MAGREFDYHFIHWVASQLFKLWLYNPQDIKNKSRNVLEGQRLASLHMHYGSDIPFDEVVTWEIQLPYITTLKMMVYKYVIPVRNDISYYLVPVATEAIVKPCLCVPGQWPILYNLIAFWTWHQTYSDCKESNIKYKYNMTHTDWLIACISSPKTLSCFMLRVHREP